MHTARCLSACALLSLVLAGCGGGSAGKPSAPITARAPRRSVGAPAWTRAPTRPTAAAAGTPAPTARSAPAASAAPPAARTWPAAPSPAGATTAPTPTWTRRTAAAAATPAPPRRTPSGTCAGGTCAFVCPAGFADCDAAAADGCETDVANDPENCGACGHVCPAGPGQVGTCTQGVCGIACAPGYADCNNAPFDGCEVNLATDPAHCGTCGNACAGSGAGPNQSASCTAGQLRHRLRLGLRGLQLGPQRRLRDAARHPHRLHRLRRRLRHPGEQRAGL